MHTKIKSAFSTDTSLKDRKSGEAFKLIKGSNLPCLSFNAKKRILIQRVVSAVFSGRYRWYTRCISIHKTLRMYVR